MSLFKPEIPTEGGGLARMVGLMRALGYNDGGDIHRAVITSEYPDFRIRIDVETIETPSMGIVCNPDLFPRTETVKIDGVERTIEYPKKLVKGATVFAFIPEHGQLVYVLCMGE